MSQFNIQSFIFSFFHIISAFTHNTLSFVISTESFTQHHSSNIHSHNSQHIHTSNTHSFIHHHSSFIKSKFNFNSHINFNNITHTHHSSHTFHTFIFNTDSSFNFPSHISSRPSFNSISIIIPSFQSFITFFHIQINHQFKSHQFISIQSSSSSQINLQSLHIHSFNIQHHHSHQVHSTIQFIHAFNQFNSTFIHHSQHFTLKSTSIHSKIITFHHVIIQIINHHSSSHHIQSQFKSSIQFIIKQSFIHSTHHSSSSVITFSHIINSFTSCSLHNHTQCLFIHIQFITTSSSSLSSGLHINHNQTFRQQIINTHSTQLHPHQSSQAAFIIIITNSVISPSFILNHHHSFQSFTEFTFSSLSVKFSQTTLSQPSFIPQSSFFLTQSHSHPFHPFIQTQRESTGPSIHSFIHFNSHSSFTFIQIQFTFMFIHHSSSNHNHHQSSAHSSFQPSSSSLHHHSFSLHTTIHTIIQQQINIPHSSFIHSFHTFIHSQLFIHHYSPSIIITSHQSSIQRSLHPHSQTITHSSHNPQHHTHNSITHIKAQSSLHTQHINSASQCNTFASVHTFTAFNNQSHQFSQLHFHRHTQSSNQSNHTFQFIIHSIQPFTAFIQISQYTFNFITNHFNITSFIQSFITHSIQNSISNQPHFNSTSSTISHSQSNSVPIHPSFIFKISHHTSQKHHNHHQFKLHQIHINSSSFITSFQSFNIHFHSFQFFQHSIIHSFNSFIQSSITSSSQSFISFNQFFTMPSIIQAFQAGPFIQNSKTAFSILISSQFIQANSKTSIHSFSFKSHSQSLHTVFQIPNIHSLNKPSSHHHHSSSFITFITAFHNSIHSSSTTQVTTHQLNSSPNKQFNTSSFTFILSFHTHSNFKHHIHISNIQSIKHSFHSQHHIHTQPSHQHQTFSFIIIISFHSNHITIHINTFHITPSHNTSTIHIHTIIQSTHSTSKFHHTFISHHINIHHQFIIHQPLFFNIQFIHSILLSFHRITSLSSCPSFPTFSSSSFPSISLDP